MQLSPYSLLNQSINQCSSTFTNQRICPAIGALRMMAILFTKIVTAFGITAPVVRLKPYNKRISNIAPILNTNAASSSSSSSSSSNTRITNMNVTPRIYTPPSSFSENFSSRFTAVGLWGASVDRIGVLDKPAIPVAWKGDNPEIIYAWTGNLWTQLLPLKNSKAINTLRNAAYDLKREATKTRMKWTDDDTHALSNYAASWGYEWLGVIKLSESD